MRMPSSSGRPPSGAVTGLLGEFIRRQPARQRYHRAGGELGFASKGLSLAETRHPIQRTLRGLRQFE